MASRIKGITVEIGGNVGPLQQALKGVNTTIYETQSKLKDVEKLLKLDPTNTELLRQKQETLGTAISATKDKLETLKKTSEEVTVSAEKYDAWKEKYTPIQAQITKTENDLEKLKKEAEDCDKKIAEGVKAEAKYNSLQTEITETESDLEKLKAQAEDADKQLAEGKISQEKYDEIQQSVTDTENKLASLKEQSEETERVMNEGKLAKEKYDELQTKIQDTEGKLESLQAQAKATSDEFGNPISPEQYDAIQREIIETEQNLERLAQQAADANEALTKIGDVGETLQGVGDKIAGVGQSLTTHVTLPLAAAGAAGVKSFAEVDKTMQLTNKTMGNSAEQAEMLSQAMKDAAANSTFGMSDAATATLNFARAGLDAEQAAAALAPAMNLAAGEGGNLDAVSAGLVATINGFHGSFKDAGKYADVFAAACNNSALDVDSLSHAMSVAAPIFASAGYSVNDAALYMGVMANNGIDADKAANSLKTGIARLVSPAKEGAEKMAELGISVTNADGSMKDSITIQKELHDAFGKLSESEQIAAASAIFGKNQMAPWLALINTAPEDVGALSLELDGASLSIEDFAKQLDASGLSLDGMKSSMEKLGVSEKDFDDILKASGGNAELFAEGLWEACDKGVSFEDVVNALGGDLDGLQTVMKNTKGTTDTMAEAMMSGFGGSLEKLKSSIDVMVTSIGEALAPMILKVSDAIQKLVDKFNSLTPAQQQTIAKIGVLVAAIGPAVLVVGKLTKGFGKALEHIGKFGKKILTLVNQSKMGVGALSKITPTVAGIAAAVGIAIAAFVHLWKNNEEFRNKVTAIWENVKTKFANFIQGIKDRLSSLGISFTSVTSTIKELWDGFCNLLAPVFEAAFEIISTVFGAVLDQLTGILDIFIGIFTGNWEQVWTGVKEYFGGIWEAITGVLSAALDGLKGIADTFLGWFGTDWDTVWKSVSTTAETIWGNITGFFQNSWDTIKGIWEPVAGWFESLWETIHTNPVLGTIADIVAAPFTLAYNTIKTLWEGVTGFFSGLWETITTMLKFDNPAEAIDYAFTVAYTSIRNLWLDITGFFSDLWKNITENETLQGIVAAISGFFSDAYNAIAGEDGIWTHITGFFSGIWETITNSEGLTGLLDALKAPFEGAYNFIAGEDGIWSKITGFFSDIWSAITGDEGLSGLLDVITKPFIDAYNAIKEAWDKVTGFFSGIFGGIKDDENLTGIEGSIRTPFEGAWTFISDTFSGIGATIAGWFDGIDISEKVATVSNWVSGAWDTITGSLENVGSTIAGWFDGIDISDKISKVSDWAEGAWGTISEWFSGAKTNIEGFFDGIDISEKVSAVSSWAAGAWQSIKDAFNADGGVKEWFSTTFEGIGDTIRGVVGDIGQWATDTWEGVKGAAKSVGGWFANLFGWGTDDDEASKELETNSDSAGANAKAALLNAFSGADTEVAAVFESMLTLIGTSINGIVKAFEEAWKKIQENTQQKGTEIKTSVQNTLKDVDSEVTSKTKSIIDTLQRMIDTAKDVFDEAKRALQQTLFSMGMSVDSMMDNMVRKVQDAVNTIRNSMNFSWHLPYLAMPHINITGNWGFNPPSVPSFNVQWYKSAMEKGAILNNPTIFGMLNGKFLGAGEAGSETVVGTKSLMDMIRDAVSGLPSMQTINYGGVSINVYAREGQDVKQLAKEIEHQMNIDIIRQRAGYA